MISAASCAADSLPADPRIAAARNCAERFSPVLCMKPVMASACAWARERSVSASALHSTNHAPCARTCEWAATASRMLSTALWRSCAFHSRQNILSGHRQSDSGSGAEEAARWLIRVKPNMSHMQWQPQQ